MIHSRKSGLALARVAAGVTLLIVGMFIGRAANVPLPFLAAPAPRITKAEFKRLQYGMDYSDAVQIVGEPGDRKYAYIRGGVAQKQEIEWKNADGSWGSIVLKEGRIAEKWPYGLK